MGLEVVIANREQRSELARLSYEFSNESEFVEVDPVYAAANYDRMSEGGYGGMLALVDDGVVLGGLGYVIAPDLHFPRKMAVETFWYIRPENRGGGLRLLHAFEKLAADLKCDAVAMIHMVDSHPEALEKLYIHRDYRMMEKHYVKQLKEAQP